MKRWWNTTSYAGPVPVTRRRVGRVLAPAMMAGAVCLALPLRTLGQCADSRTATSDPQLVARGLCVHLPRTGGAVIEAWAFGTLSDAKQPDSQVCDLEHLCELAISSVGGAGTGHGTTIKNSPGTSSQVDPSPNLPFTLTETIDYKHPVIKGVRGDNGPGACYPASGVMSIAVDASSTLVLDIVGQACQVGINTARLLVTGTDVSDTASTGTVANADGIGSVYYNPGSLRRRNQHASRGHHLDEGIVGGPAPLRKLASGHGAVWGQAVAQKKSSKNRSEVSAAAEHYRAGRLTEAESLYRGVLDRHPDNVDATQGLAVLCHQRGRPEEALALFRRAIMLDPNSRVADQQFGRLLEQRGDLVGAAICYRRTARLRPFDAAPQADLARTLAGEGEVAEAVAHYRRAISLAPDDAWNHIALGNALMRVGAVADALASYERAIAISPDLPEAHSNSGEALRRMGRLSEAVAACQRALVLRPLAEAHNNLGNALRQEGRTEPATSHYEQALRLKPDWAEVHNNLAIALQERGRTEEAIRHYERALLLDSGLAEVLQNLGGALAQSGRTVEAVAALRRALGSARLSGGARPARTPECRAL